LGLSLIALTGSGPDGLIVEQDVLTAARVTAPAVRELGSGVRVPLSGMRGVIARRMRQSLEQNAQAVHKVSVRMDEAKRAIALMRERGHKIGYNAIIALATVRALVEHPELNAEIVGNEIWRKDFVNLGIAVAVPDGLMVPVVRDAHRLSLLQLSAAMRELADRARDGRLAPDDCSGGSFTLSNLGMLGLEEFTAIINPPEAGILAVGKVEDTPLAVDGRVEIHPVVRLTLSYDHRIVDGAPAALFLAHIKLYLETPPLMML
jgi:pyruvate dehydrogenase E2 component (dihydrolipoamide acetyltransferase)